MSFQFMPVFTGDYLRDTRHLSPCEHGVYMLSLMHSWDQKGPMPLDERRQFAIVNARSGDEMEAWRRVRDEFFVRMDDGWYQPRMQREIERSEAISTARSQAGKRGAEKRTQAIAKQLPSKRQAIVSTPTPTPTPTTTTTTTEEKNDFDIFWKSYPRKENKQAAQRAWQKLSAGERETAARTLPSHAGRWTDPNFVPHCATWLNGKRWEDELPPIRQTKAQKFAADLAALGNGEAVGFFNLLESRNAN